MKFPGKNRLKSRADFQRVFAKPVKYRNRDISLFAQRNDQNVARLGLAVSKKVSRRAVDRNRIKRLIRESFRLYILELAGWDIIAVAHPHCADRDSNSIFATLSCQWERIKRVNAQQPTEQ